MDPVYFAHGYREREAPFAAHFGSLMQRVGFLASLDPPSNDVNAAKLERHLGYTTGTIAVLSDRSEGPSPHILFEISMCLRARKPLLVFLEDSIPDDIIPRGILRKRFSASSYVREMREHMHALEIFRTYVGQQPVPKYQAALQQRSCVLIGLKTIRGDYQRKIVAVIEEKGYRPIVIDAAGATVIQKGEVHFETSNSSLAICCIDDKTPVSNYILGVVQDALVPTIVLTTNKDSPLNSDIPLEYQRRLIPAKEIDEGLSIIQQQIELFEEDFVELDTEKVAEKYGRLLMLNASPSGEYTHDTRTHIVQEVTMGDKYITSGQVGAVGPGAHAHDLHFDQIWNQSAGEIDIVSLSGELSRLRERLRSEAQTPEQDIAVAAVANAEVAARNGDGPKAMEWLNKSGKWAFDVATKIGVGVATAALKAALGI
jgi:hypothetical protein